MRKWEDRKKQYVKDWKKNNPKALTKHSHDYNKRRTKKRMEFLLEIRKEGSCFICGYKEHPEILEFHHKNPKEKEINICAVRDLTRIKKEILKCELVCPNCHRWFHHSSKPPN